MAQTRSQLENLSKEELIGELITVDDITSKISDLTNQFNDFLRRFEVVSSDLAITKNCNRLLTKRVVQLERNAVTNISKEQKSVFLLGDFNVNLLNYNEHNQANEFLDSLASNSFIPLILQPTRITRHSNTLIDNIFSNAIDPDIISGNLTATISDHLPQFSIIPNMFGNISGNKYKIYEGDWSKFDQENFILDYFSVDWEDMLKSDELNVDNSTKMYLDKINMLLDTYAPLKRINKYKMKFKSKPSITLGLQKSISVKNKLLKNFINKKDAVLKEKFHTNYKKYRNLLSTLMEKSKQAYYDKYFERN